jgi:transcriptional regulator with XRE-family HTH domain
MDLYEWLTRKRIEDRNFKDIQFAKKLGINRAQISRLKQGRYRPSVELAMKIEELTDGQVNAWEILKTATENMKEKK